MSSQHKTLRLFKVESGFRVFVPGHTPSHPEYGPHYPLVSHGTLLLLISLDHRRAEQRLTKPEHLD